MAVNLSELATMDATAQAELVRRREPPPGALRASRATKGFDRSSSPLAGLNQQAIAIVEWHAAWISSLSALVLEILARRGPAGGAAGNRVLSSARRHRVSLRLPSGERRI